MRGVFPSGHLPAAGVNSAKPKAAFGRKLAGSKGAGPCCVSRHANCCGSCANLSAAVGMLSSLTFSEGYRELEAPTFTPCMRAWGGKDPMLMGLAMRDLSRRREPSAASGARTSPAPSPGWRPATWLQRADTPLAAGRGRSCSEFAGESLTAHKTGPRLSLASIGHAASGSPLRATPLRATPPWARLYGLSTLCCAIGNPLPIEAGTLVPLLRTKCCRAEPLALSAWTHWYLACLQSRQDK
jgi:hypothetical protein